MYAGPQQQHDTKSWDVGFDSFLPKAEGDTDAQAVLVENGAIAPVIGEEGSDPKALAADTEGPTVSAREWHSLAFVVDTNVGAARTYVDGALSVEAQSTKIARDGQFAIKGRVALLWERNGSPRSVAYVRALVCIHVFALARMCAR